jgi:hypothetical protein
LNVSPKKRYPLYVSSLLPARNLGRLGISKRIHLIPVLESPTT